jgi:serine/threonine protein kinase
MKNDVAKARSIFISAVEEYRPDQWAKFLDDACREDVALRRRVEHLLRAHYGEDSFLDRGDEDEGGTDSDRPIAEGPGTIIGPYKLLEQIGEGGFGVVFLAEQERPMKRRVALKIIKPGMDTRQVIARFEAERQALAMMDHPNIAKVFDAGTTSVAGTLRVPSPDVDAASEVSHGTRSVPATFGRPYFVMELVQGVPITEYCDQCNLTTRERLELFITVCQAVQHAHQKGVIHRDIKPTNVLVAMQDGRPAPKIIDFGVAKAINQQLTEHTLTTAFAQMVGTPMYMSPEQAELSPLGVDTRSDIYSLGVMLYELLAGTTPFDKDRLHAASYDELRRIIREEEPPRPSSRISTLAANLSTTVAEHRRTDVRRLSQQVRGELDWIVMKCLEKDRNRRYDSAGSLARDIERYLHDEPVQACPPSIPYRFKKFVRRNKVAAAFVALLLISVAGLGISNLTIKRERDAKTTALSQAKAVSDLLQEMLGSADAERAKGSQYTVRELLDDFSAGLGNQLADEPAVEADIRATIGRAYRSLGVAERGQPHLERAIELRRQVDGPQHENVAAILVDYAQNLENQLRLEEAETEVRKALEIYRQRGVSGAPVIHALRILQDALISSADITGRDVDAERATQEALSIARRSGEEFPELATMLHRYAAMRREQARYAEAEQLAHQAVAMHRRVHNGPHPELGYGLRTLADTLQQQQKFAEAESACRESLAVFRRCFPADHPDVRSTIDALRTLLEARGVKSATDEFDSEDTVSDSAGDHLRLAGLLLTKNPSGDVQKEVARRLIQRAIDEYGQVAVNSPGNLRRRLRAVDGFVKVATLCITDSDLAGELDQVNRQLTAELEALHSAFPNSTECHLCAADAYACCAYFSATNQRQEEAADFLRKSTLALERVPDPADSVNSLYLIAIMQLRLGDEVGYRESCAAMFRVPPGSRNDSTELRRAWIWCLGPHVGEDLSMPLKHAEEFAVNNSFGAPYLDLAVLGGMLYRAGQYKRAAKCLEESIAAYPSDPPQGYLAVVFPQLFLAMTNWQQGHRDEARRMLADILPTIDEYEWFPSHSGYWTRPAFLEVLRSEAEAMIGPTKADEAAANKSRTNDEPEQ